MITAQQLALMNNLWEITQWIEFQATCEELDKLIAEVYKLSPEGARIIAALIIKVKRSNWHPPDYITTPIG